MKTIKNLLLALLNATLILVALCLFLGLQLTQSAERAAEKFSEGVTAVSPLKTEVAQARDAVAGLTSELDALKAVPGALTQAAQAALQQRIDALNATMEQISDRLAALDQIPERVVTTAIDHTADRISGVINDYLTCTPESPAS